MFRDTYCGKGPMSLSICQDPAEIDLLMLLIQSAYEKASSSFKSFPFHFVCTQNPLMGYYIKIMFVNRLFLSAHFKLLNHIIIFCIIKEQYILLLYT